MCIELHSHNEKTYNKIIDMWKESNLVAACQPTGTGKSYLIMRCAEDFNGENIVIVTTRKPIIEQFQKLDKHINGITYITYTKLINMLDEEIKQLNPVFIAFDEFHHCGADVWEKSVQKLFAYFPKAKVLGTSATPIRYGDNGRNMADEMFDGNLACDMTINEALIQEILTMPKYVSALYTYDNEADNMIQKINKGKNSEEEKIELIGKVNKLRNKLEKSKGVPKILNKYITKSNGRYLVFCKNRDHIAEIKPVVIDWFNKYFKMSKLNYSVDTYEVYSDLVDSDEQLKSFIDNNAENTVKLLFCINMLNEGLHISNLDGEILLRPTTSPTMYYQQIGRVTDAGRTEQSLILDLVNNFASVKTINGFGKDLEKEAKKYCCKNGISGNEENEFIDKFKIIDETCDALKLFGEIEFRLRDRWNLNIKALSQFFNREGHSDVLSEHIEFIDGYRVYLGRFVSDVRHVYNGRLMNYELTAEKISELKKYDFVFDIKKNTYEFENVIKLLIEYKTQFGNCNVPQRCKYKDFDLGSYVSNLRISYKNDKIEAYKMNKLKEIGFVFDILCDKWNLNYNIVKNIYVTNGNSNLPRNYIAKNGIKIGEWEHTQRKNFVENKLSSDKIKKLEQIGFIFITNSEKNIICLETKDKFNSITEAAKWCNLKGSSSISFYVAGKLKSAGKHPKTGEKLHWMFYDEYVKLYGEIDSLKEVI